MLSGAHPEILIRLYVKRSDDLALRVELGVSLGSTVLPTHPRESPVRGLRGNHLSRIFLAEKGLELYY